LLDPECGWYEDCGDVDDLTPWDFGDEDDE